MTDNDPTPLEPELAPVSPEELDFSPPDEEPRYLIETGQVAAEDGSVVPIIGGLPAAEGSAWDIGAPLEDRGAGLAQEQADRRE